MKRRLVRPAALPAFAAAFVLAAAGAAAQAQDPGRADLSRTPWGDPDLQGVWNNNTVVPLERPETLADKARLTDEEAAERFRRTSEATFAEREGDPTSLVVDPPDGRLPPLTSQGRARADAGAHRFPDGREPVASWQELSLFDRCITRGLPGAMSPGFYNHNYHILQTSTHVVLMVEMIHDSRIIPIDGRPHAPDGVRQWLGDSRGRWEGDTLVVETKNFTRKTNTRMATVFGGGRSLRLVERFTRVDADTIDYRYTFEDDAEFTRPWTAAVPLNRVEEPLFEYACHEGNYAMEGVLAGSRVTEEVAAAQDGGR